MNNLLYVAGMLALISLSVDAMFTAKLVKPVAAATAAVGTAVGIKKFPVIKQQIERSEAYKQWQQEYAKQHIPKPSDR